MIKAKISQIEIYYGKKTVPAKDYIEHFERMGIDSTSLTNKVFGRKSLSEADDETESSLTMGLTVAKNVLNKAGLTGEDIDLVIFSSQLGEFLVPPISTIIHKEIGGKQNALCYDLNVNCIGMTVALEHTIKYMNASPNIKRALVVGSEYLTPTVNPIDPTTYGVFGDGACAIILEQTTEDCGLIESKYSIFNELVDNMVYPPCGMKKIMKPNSPISIEELAIDIKPLRGNWGQLAIQDIKDVIKNSGILKDDIAMICASQLSLSNINMVREALDIPMEKIPQVSVYHGYTGTTSPFMVLYEAIKNKTVQRGDYILFWTIGGGLQSVSVLIKY